MPRFLLWCVEEGVVEIREHIVKLVTPTASQVRDNVVHLMVLEELVAFIAIARFVNGAGHTTLWVDFSTS
jgi:hypothetical protein